MFHGHFNGDVSGIQRRIRPAKETSSQDSQARAGEVPDPR